MQLYSNHDISQTIYLVRGVDFKKYTNVINITGNKCDLQLQDKRSMSSLCNWI